MRSFLRHAGIGLLFVVIALCLAIACVPPFLDRIYYAGPRSAHFDGRRFFNPDEAADPPRHGFNPLRMARLLTGRDSAAWPRSVPVVQTRPPRAVVGSAMRVTWIGHATVLVQTQGLNILTDPVWSDHAGPAGLGPKRVTAPGVRFEDLPHIDLVLVSHAHYDHMDLATLRRLWDRDRPLVVTALGNDTILRGAGVPAVTRDWGGRVRIRPGIDVIVERVHHWGTRRGADRNRSLWSGFTVTLPGGDLFMAGDTGFGDGRWPAEAAAHGPIRLALLPIGAFLPRSVMAPNHIGPVEAVEVFRRLGARSALAIHWGTFRLSDESRDAPPELLAQTLEQGGVAPGRFRATAPGESWMVP